MWTLVLLVALNHKGGKMFPEELIKQEIQSIRFEAPIRLPAKEVESLAVQRLAQERALLQLARERGISVPDEELDWFMYELKREFPTESDFYTLLEETGRTEEQVREQMRKDLTIFFLMDNIAKDIQISDDDTVPRPKEVTYKEIFIYSNPDESQIRRQRKILKAWRIWFRLKTGADFDRLAKKYSSRQTIEKTSSWLPTSATVLTAFRMKPGQISKPIVSNWGITIIKVVKVTGGEPVRYGDLPYRLKRLVFREKVLEKLNSLISDR